ncbi:phosphoribosylamine--glycine ligase [candidate division KSB1 bacterium]
MKILVIGSGGREHTLVWKIDQSSKVDHIICAPGNGGISEIAECVNIKADDIDGLLELAISRLVDFTVVGPEVPLNLGIVDIFREKGLKVFGPVKNAAAIEGSKIFAKELMKKYNIPSAEFDTFTDINNAKEYIESKGAPIVVKADGLAAGKGAIVCQTVDEAYSAVDLILSERAFGSAGDGIVIEECMFGEEASIFVLTDGNDFLTLPSSQDHKAVYDGDKGPNTGGMGAYSPAPLIDDALAERINKEIIKPTIDAMRQEGMPYTGLLYAGLMITEDGPKVIEFNCRFGDPETQAVLPLVENDLIDLLMATTEGTISDHELKSSKKYSVCVIMASAGYPGRYEKGKKISNLEAIEQSDSRMVFHAGTKIEEGAYFTNGGRVLCVNALENDLESAISESYGIVKTISFENAYFRNDIGLKGLKRLRK